MLLLELNYTFFIRNWFIRKYYSATQKVKRVQSGTKPGGHGGAVPPQLKNFARPCPPTKYMLFVQKENSKNLT